MNLTEIAISNIKNYIIEQISYACYEEPNGVDTKIDIAESIITEDGTVGFLVKANFSTPTTIMVLKLYDSEDICWLSQYCDIRIDVTEITEVPIWFYFKIEEEM